VKVELDIPGGTYAQRVEIQVTFVNHYDVVEISYAGSKTASAGLEDQAPSARTSVAGGPSEHHNIEVSTALLPVIDNLMPAIWEFTVTVTHANATLFEVTCRDVDLSGITSGVHILKVTQGRSECGADSGVAGSEPPLPPRDVAVRSFPVNATVTQGDVVRIQVEVANEGNMLEQFNVLMTDTPEAGQAGSFSPAQALVANLAIGGVGAAQFDWNTAGAALGLHVLRATIPPVSRETDTADNAQEIAVNVVAPPVHDLSIEALTAASPVLAGVGQTVTIQARNNGGTAETFTVTLTDTPPAGTPMAVGTSSPVTLGAAGGPNDAGPIYIPWTPGSPPGTHVLTASIAPVTGETVTANNTRSTNVVVEYHDAQAVSVASAAAANIGDVLPVTVTVANNGNVTDTIQVSLSAQPPGAGTAIPIGTQSVSVNAGTSGVAAFNWDTACIAPAGSWTLSATTSVPNDAVPANNASTGTPVALAEDRELSIAFLSPPTSATQGQVAQFHVSVTNGKSVPEPSVDLSFTSARQGGGPAGPTVKDSRLPIALACGEQTVLTFLWVPPSLGGGTYNLTATVTTAIPGDNPADNTGTVTVNVP
jgi:hypothetical protein